LQPQRCMLSQQAGVRAADDRLHTDPERHPNHAVGYRVGRSATLATGSTKPGTDPHRLRDLVTARLTHKRLLSESAQCFHLEFAFEHLPADLAGSLARNVPGSPDDRISRSASAGFAFAPGQFLSCVATDPATGKQQTRAYSLASAPVSESQAFAFCINRVSGGFFSNLLCDLEVGATLEAHGPHGFFTLPEEEAPLVLVAASTGIAPMRGFLQTLFPATGAPAKQDIWLVQGAEDECATGFSKQLRERSGDEAEDGRSGRPERNQSTGDLYYEEEFTALAAAHRNFHYIPISPTPSPNEALLQHLDSLTRELAPLLPAPPPPDADPRANRGPFPVYSYICGLNAMVAPARELFRKKGWARRQVLFERYD
jgi:ferredoxin-NADP reductase